jgi:16S rRNA processing protein RimM
LVGEIVGVHGVKGVVKVRSFLDADSIFGVGSRVLIQDAQGLAKACTVEWAKPHVRQLLVRFEGFTKREQVEKWIGAAVLAERESLPPLAEGEYFWSDLIGLSVFEMDGQFIGRLDNIIATGSNDVYVVRDGRRETLIPALESVVKEIDLERGRMQVQLPEGL